MKQALNATPILLIVVLGVLGIFVKGMGNREQGIGNTVSRNSQQCQIVKGSIYDGDTLRVNCGGETKKVRLACIDAPEAKQEGGIQSRDYLRSLINKHGSEVGMIPLEQDKYNRTVAELVLAPGKTPEVSIQEEMLLSGNARVYEQYSNCPNISAFRLAQEIGQKNKAGVWGYASVAPWEWRKSNK